MSERGPEPAGAGGWRLLADENFPGPSVGWLRRAGHDVVWIAEVSPGLDDPAVLAMARAEGRVALTFDRDLAERLVRYRDPPPAGLVLLRFVPAHPTHAAEVTAALLTAPALDPRGRLTVVTPERVRQRPLLSAS